MNRKQLPTAAPLAAGTVRSGSANAMNLARSGILAIRYGRRLPSLFTALLLVVVSLGSMPAIAGCKAAKEACAPFFNPCCGSMACELTAWPPECRHRPPREGEVCTVFSPCAGSGLYCKGFQDGLAGRCTKYSKLGEECDGIITLCGDGLACTQDARYPDVSKYPGKGRCYPMSAGTWPWDDDRSCLASYSEKVHRNLPMGSGMYPELTPLDGVRAMSFGSGASLSAVVGGSFEKGGVYGSNGTYGCYRSTCYLWEGNVAFTAFSSIGQYETYDEVSGTSYELYTGAGVIFGAARAKVFEIDPRNLDPGEELSEYIVGETFSVSFGVDVVPITAGLAYCTTEVNEVIRDWREITVPAAKCADRNVCGAAPSACSAAVSVDAGSTVPGDGAPVLKQIPPGPYPIGETQVTLRVTGPSGDSDSCSALVDVRDCTPPELTCRQTVAECEHDRMAFVTPLPPSVEECTAYSVNGPPATDYPLGDTPARFVVTDAYFNESSCDTRIRVVDTQPPQILSATAQPGVLWPPNRRMHQVQIGIEARDACDPDAACVLTSVESNERDRNWWNWKDKSGDARIVGPRTVELRAERSGFGSGRVYTVRFECTDTTAGNVAQGSVQIMVPHDMRK
jgi:hypothetical protein